MYVCMSGVRRDACVVQIIWVEHWERGIINDCMADMYKTSADVNETFTSWVVQIYII